MTAAVAGITKLGRAPTAEERPYTPRGAAQDLWWYQGKEVLLSGPAGTGKSRACLEKLHHLARRYPGMRGLILRKTRESLSESALVTWEEKVVPKNHPINRGAHRRSRRSYRYPNGSEIVVGGLRQSGKDMTQKVMSTEYDVIYIQEAIELSQEEWEKATTRLRNGVMPYQQLMADTNPSAPTHWLKKRCDVGRTLLMESRHEDNPVLWDAAKGCYTRDGLDYLAILDALSGPRYMRLRHGRWVQAEGVIYTEYDPKIHLVERRRVVPWDWPRYLVVDFGYTHPFVCSWWCKDPDGRLYRYREIYMTGRLVADHAKQIREQHKKHNDPKPRLVICDHDAEDRATLERELGWSTVAARKEISPGIQAVQKRLRPAKDGKPRLVLWKDSLVEVDRNLREAGHPVCTEEEFDCYTWDVGVDGSKKEEPIDQYNHGMDTVRYLVAEFDLVGRTSKPREVVAGWKGLNPHRRRYFGW